MLFLESGFVVGSINIDLLGMMIWSVNFHKQHQRHRIEFQKLEKRQCGGVDPCFLRKRTHDVAEKAQFLKTVQAFATSLSLVLFLSLQSPPVCHTGPFFFLSSTSISTDAHPKMGPIRKSLLAEPPYIFHALHYFIIFCLDHCATSASTWWMVPT